MQQDSVFFTQAIYDYMQSCNEYASGYINSVRGNFDSFTYDEKIFFLDAIHDMEAIIIECGLYFLQFNKVFRTTEQLDKYRVVQDDTLVSIANKFYGDPTKWVEIYTTNKLKDFDLTDVATLIIPKLKDAGNV